jgi:hypothetical protein
MEVLNLQNGELILQDQRNSSQLSPFLFAKKILAFFHQKYLFFLRRVNCPYFSKILVGKGGAVDSNFADLENLLNI